MMIPIPWAFMSAAWQIGEHCCVFGQLSGVRHSLTTLLGFFHRKRVDPPSSYVSSATGTHSSHSEYGNGQQDQRGGESGSERKQKT